MRRSASPGCTGGRSYRRRCAWASGVSAPGGRWPAVAGRCCAVCITHSIAGFWCASRRWVAVYRPGARGEIRFATYGELLNGAPCACPRGGPSFHCTAPEPQCAGISGDERHQGRPYRDQAQCHPDHSDIGAHRIPPSRAGWRPLCAWRCDLGNSPCRSCPPITYPDRGRLRARHSDRQVETSAASVPRVPGPLAAGQRKAGGAGPSRITMWGLVQPSVPSPPWDPWNSQVPWLDWVT